MIKIIFEFPRITVTYAVLTSFLSKMRWAFKRLLLYKGLQKKSNRRQPFHKNPIFCLIILASLSRQLLAYPNYDPVVLSSVAVIKKTNAIIQFTQQTISFIWIDRTAATNLLSSLNKDIIFNLDDGGKELGAASFNLKKNELIEFMPFTQAVPLTSLIAQENFLFKPFSLTLTRNILAEKIINEPILEEALQENDDGEFVGFIDTEAFYNGVAIAHVEKMDQTNNTTYMFDFDGDGLFSFDATHSFLNNVSRQSGLNVNDWIENSATLVAEKESYILLSPKAKRFVLGHAINRTKNVQANSIYVKKGTIILKADDNKTLEMNLLLAHIPLQKKQKIIDEMKVREQKITFRKSIRF